MNHERVLSIKDTRGTRMFCAQDKTLSKSLYDDPCRSSRARNQQRDDRRVSWKPITETYPAYNPPKRHQRQEGFVLRPSTMRYRYHSDFMHGVLLAMCTCQSHERAAHTIWNLRYLKCLLNVHDDAKGACTKRISNGTAVNRLYSGEQKE